MACETQRTAAKKGQCRRRRGGRVDSCLVGCPGRASLFRRQLSKAPGAASLGEFPSGQRQTGSVGVDQSAARQRTCLIPNAEQGPSMLEEQDRVPGSSLMQWLYTPKMMSEVPALTPIQIAQQWPKLHTQ